MPPEVCDHPKATDRIRVVFYLSRKEHERAQRIAKERGVSVTEFFRTALSHEAFLDDELRKGQATMLIETADRAREIIFPELQPPHRKERVYDDRAIRPQ